jgi:hypothetical protein
MEASTVAATIMATTRNQLVIQMTTAPRRDPGAVFFGTANNVDSHVTVTRDAFGIMNAYLNQQHVLTFNDAAGALVFGNVARFFMDDGVQGTEASSGQFDLLRIFDSALTGAEVAALADPLRPANNNVPEPASTARAGRDRYARTGSASPAGTLKSREKS